jgi:hypothetical protein
MVKSFLYQTFIDLDNALLLSDQLVLRPAGSTAAAVITIMHTVTTMLAVNPSAVILALNFSKAFDRVYHVTLLQKLDQLKISDVI